MSRSMKLNVGDRVLVSEPWGFHESRHKTGTVIKRTPSGITTVAVDAYPPHGTIAHEQKFTARGWRVGEGAYSGYSLDEYDEQVLKDERRRDAVAKARSFLRDYEKWRGLSDDAILRIYKIIHPLIAKATGQKAGA